MAYVVPTLLSDSLVVILFTHCERVPGCLRKWLNQSMTIYSSVCKSLRTCHRIKLIYHRFCRFDRQQNYFFPIFSHTSYIYGAAATIGVFLTNTVSISFISAYTSFSSVETVRLHRDYIWSRRC